MSFDGLVTRAVVHELQNALAGGRVTKIYQPGEYELLFHIRSQGETHRLILSAHPAYPRFHLTRERTDNPKEPPMFCMLLRKHLEGASSTGWSSWRWTGSSMWTSAPGTSWGMR